ncbi:nitroreductase family deazaflavin-dependent oxidoreductase [Nocardia sp. NPDC055321]
MSDGIAPRWLALFNRRVTNRFARLYAGRIPPYSLIHHRGRRSGKPFTTPVLAHFDHDRLYVPLPYGTGSDWVRNVLAGGGEVTYRRTTRRFTGPRIVEAGAAGELPGRVRRLSRVTRILVADLTVT